MPELANLNVLLLLSAPRFSLGIPPPRSKEYVGLNLSVVVWKALVGQEVQLSDLENVDVLLTRSMQDIRTIDQKGEKKATNPHVANFTPSPTRAPRTTALTC